MYTVTIGRTFINGEGLKKKQKGTWNFLGHLVNLLISLNTKHIALCL